MIESLWTPFTEPTMQRAAVAVLLAALGCAWLGVHAAERRMALVGDALSHAMLPGIVAVVVLGLPLLLGALVGSLLAAASVWWASRDRRIGGDSAIGIVYTGLFALGVILHHHFAIARDLEHLLVGSPLGTNGGQLLGLAAITLVACLALLWFHRLLAVTLLDQRYAADINYPPGLARAVVLIVAALVVVVALNVVGIVLTVALLITPAATARLWSRSLVGCIASAIAVAMLAAILGMLASWHADWPMGPAIVLALAVCFLIARLVTALWRG